MLSVNPTAEVVAQEAFARALTGSAAGLRDKAMSLISGLLTSEDGPSAMTGDESIAVKVISGPSSIRIEIKDAGSGVVLEGLRRPRQPASRGWSPHLLSRIADRWGLVSGAQGAAPPQKSGLVPASMHTAFPNTIVPVANHSVEKKRSGPTIRSNPHEKASMSSPGRSLSEAADAYSTGTAAPVL